MVENKSVIDREQVYEICGYEDYRMLRGFTLPTSRMTRDLQREGIVAEDVKPVLMRFTAAA